MRNILVILVLACLAIQYPLRLGDSGYKRVDELNLQLKAQQETNKAMTARNAAMLAEIEDLKSGTQALEDYARTEMSMVDANEVLVRVLPPNEEVPIAPIRIGSQLPQQ
ncbi:septum formation initiator family protein [Pelistega suis]|uniref:Cell division protein FtsB n=1 Tax=Pelistega suis TaxID=1631957 RepID=A0A849P1T9_9BURK|nr:septum formation initiator family protein [Pelistega suis]NOL51669.1 cell division protein FtsB [Pelistega suis]